MHLFCQLSNALGLFPVVYCLKHRLYGFGVIIATSLTLSVLYHVNENNEWFLFADMVGVSFLVALGYYTYLRSVVVFTWSNCLTILFASAGFACYLLAGDEIDSEQYHIFHSLWHAFSFYGCATYLYSYINTHGGEDSRLLCRPVRIRVLDIRRAVEQWRELNKNRRRAVKTDLHAALQAHPDLVESRV